MLQKFFLVIVAALCFLPNSAVAENSTPRIVVLPFEIFSQDESSSLADEIPKVIRTFLEQEGADIVHGTGEEMASGRISARDMQNIRNIGIKNGADYVIWGSLTRIGLQFSLDAKMVRSFDKQPPHAFFVRGDKMENLPTSVKNMARDMGLKIFKREKVLKVIISGNKRIEADAIRTKIETKPGDVYLARSLARDLKSIYAMGYFEDIRVEEEDGPGGKIILFKVKEKPTIRVIRIKGNRVYDDEEITENMTLKTGAILNIFRLNSNVKRIEELYKEKNYHNVSVKFKVRPLENNQADIDFMIEEGEKIRIKSIRFEGNSIYTDKKLKKMMKTSEKGFFSWVTSSGEFNNEDVAQDAARLAAFYQNSGYIKARVGDPEVRFEKDWIYINIKIEEGPRYKVGQVKIDGDLVASEEQLLKALKINKETFYNRSVIRDDVLALTDFYSDAGYAYADVAPRIKKDDEKLQVDITYLIDKGLRARFEEIVISGNTKTRDKVIRRELRVYEQGLFSGRRLKRSIRNLHRLDFFEDIKVDTPKGSADDKMVLKIDVTEKPTGAFSFGGGYSSVESLFAVFSISQRNLFGRGQLLNLKAQLGGTSNRYTLSFTEPWLFDIPLSAGFDLYNQKIEYDTYDKDSIGGGIRLSYPVFDYTRVYLSYNYDRADIKNISEDASDSIWDLEGINTTSSITIALKYDSRDQVFSPTRGQNHSFSVEYAGLGGDIAFTKYLAETGWYIPLVWEFTGFLHGKTGFVKENSDNGLPDYERFYLGGMNSLRGFDWRDVSPTEKNIFGDDVRVGGDKFVQFNAEILFPLLKESGLMGVVFFDTGNAYNNDEAIDLGNMRESVGYGIRWYSPMGPIRLEYGHILDPKEDEADGQWEFTMGTAF
ncbi:MAG: outer membrane protein assembly factor BamA [Desulfobacteraceae bacterium 4572_123]|nr:MAG: outer membrane protein assembly factor BamA [Desulfobacteraceae bacterium 4572_123]